jgi:hypothetical protein
LFEFAFDEIRASAAIGGNVGDANDPVDPLTVQDPLAAADSVSSELNPFADLGRA